jgi:quercetin dioxygenase-like cupin family protein
MEQMSKDECQRDDELDPTLLSRWVEGLSPVAPPASLRERVLARARGGDQAEPLRTIRAHEGWVEFMPGVSFKMLYRDNITGARSFLARLQPGVTFPPHEHDFAEECLVLEGEITLGDITVRAGDYHFAPKGSPHGVTATQSGALLFLRAGRGQHVPEPPVS